jgi:hypothetical protein
MPSEGSAQHQHGLWRRLRCGRELFLNAGQGQGKASHYVDEPYTKVDEDKKEITGTNYTAGKEIRCKISIRITSVLAIVIGGPVIWPRKISTTLAITTEMATTDLGDLSISLVSWMRRRWWKKRQRQRRSGEYKMPETNE